MGLTTVRGERLSDRVVAQLEALIAAAAHRGPPRRWAVARPAGLAGPRLHGTAVAELLRRDGVAAERAAQLSGMAQSVGYVLAAAGPLAMGLLPDLTGGWTVPLVMLLVRG